MSVANGERFLVVTEFGRVMVRVRGDRSGLDNDFIEVQLPAEEDLVDVSMETPLRAFAAKMVDLVQARGADHDISPALLGMLVKEKAAEDLGRIERAARRLHQAGESDD